MTKRRPPQLRNQSGQMIIEYILLMVVLIGVGTALVDFLKDQGFATKFTQDPWAKLNGMIQCGVWAPCGVETPTPAHPNTEARVLTLDPKFPVY